MNGGNEFDAMEDGEHSRDALEVLRQRKFHLSEQAGKPGKLVMYRVNPFLKQVNLKKKHFVPDVVSLGLFDRATWNDGTPEKKNLKLDVAISFFADIGKDPTESWTDVTKQIVKNPTAMKDIYNESWGVCRAGPDVIQSALALDAIFLTSFLVYVGTSDIRFEEKFLRTSQTFDCEVGVALEIYSDIFMLENQIPLELVRNTIALANASRSNSSEDLDAKANALFEHMVYDFITFERPFSLPKIYDANDSEIIAPEFSQCQHFLECVSTALRIEAENELQTKSGSSQSQIASPVKRSVLENHLCFLPARVITKCFCVFKRCGLFGRRERKFKSRSYRRRERRSGKGEIDSDTDDVDETLLTVTELYKGGITVVPQSEFFPRLVPNRFSWWRAKLYLPRIRFIHPQTEKMWRNLLAFEIADADVNSVQGKLLFTSYLTFMNDLVNTKEDVSLLCTGESPVLQSIQLENYKEVADLFNQVTAGHISGLNSEPWSSIRKEIMSYHNWGTRVKIVEFTNKYFGRPWLTISIIAAVVLLILTFLQTLYQMLGYYRNSPPMPPMSPFGRFPP